MSSRTEKQEHLSELEGFLRGPVFRGWLAGLRQDIAFTEAQVLALDPITREDEIEILKLRGELRRMQSQITTFEDAASTLKDEINEMLESEAKSGTTTKI